MITEFCVPWVAVRLNKQGDPRLARRRHRDRAHSKDMAGVTVSAAAPEQALAEVYVAAGSNVEPVAHLHRALASCGRTTRGCVASRAWRNAAVGFEGDDFVNLVVAFETDEPCRRGCSRGCTPSSAACGRARDAPRWAPRSMDLDVLLYGDRVSHEPGLTLPRPDLVRRAYMLGPMAELAPHLVIRRSGSRCSSSGSASIAAAHPMQEIDLGAPPRAPAR